jgi:pyridoxamine 5'-phosphate oxidase
MDFQDCIQFANENPVCYLATMDGDQPRVRGMLMCSADESGFLFFTFSAKEMAKQLRANSKVELCYYNNPAELSGAKQMRLTGEVEWVDDKALHERICKEQRAFLVDIVGQPIEPITELFRISHGEAHFWTLMDALKEPDLERIKF